MKKDATFWLTLLATLVVIFILQFFFRNTFYKVPTKEELASSVKVVGVHSQWVDKYINPQESSIVPALTFKIRNVGKRPIQHIIVNVVFELEGLNQDLGDGWAPFLTKKALAPGETSEAITVKSSYGYRASSKRAFFDNYAQWKRCWAKVYIKWQGSEYVPFGIFEVKKEIQGVKVISSDSVAVQPLE